MNTNHFLVTVAVVNEHGHKLHEFDADLDSEAFGAACDAFKAHTERKLAEATR